MSQTNTRQAPRRGAASSQNTATPWCDVGDLHTDGPFQAAAAAGAADSDSRQLAARRRLESYLEQKRLSDALREVFQDDDCD